MLVSFRTFRSPLFPKQVSCPKLFFATSYSKMALGPLPNFKTSIYQSQVVTRALCCTNALQKKKFKVGQKKSISYYHFITLDITFEILPPLTTFALHNGILLQIFVGILHYYELLLRPSDIVHSVSIRYVLDRAKLFYRLTNDLSLVKED